MHSISRLTFAEFVLTVVVVDVEERSFLETCETALDKILKNIQADNGGLVSKRNV